MLRNASKSFIEESYRISVFTTNFKDEKSEYLSRCNVEYYLPYL